MKSTIKENWLKEDELCPTCGHVTKPAKGITKQNIRKLLVPQFNMNEIIWTFTIIMILALAFLYQSETAECRDFAKRLSENPQKICDMLIQNQSISGGKGVSIYSTRYDGEIPPQYELGTNNIPNNSFSVNINTNELNLSQS